MTIKKWKSLYSTLKIVEKAGLIVLPKPTEVALRAFEASTGYTLPESYRNFIKVFGPGELIWELRVFAPGYPEQPHADLQAFNREVKRPFTRTFLQSMSNPDRVSRLVFFSRSGMGDLFGWDHEDVRDSKRHEYGIYKLARKNCAEEVASSFSEFIESDVLSNLKLRKWNAGELGPRNTFDPAVELPQRAASSSKKGDISEAALKTVKAAKVKRAKKEK